MFITGTLDTVYGIRPVALHIAAETQFITGTLDTVYGVRPVIAISDILGDICK